MDISNFKEKRWKTILTKNEAACDDQKEVVKVVLQNL